MSCTASWGSVKRFRLLGYRQDAMSILAASDLFVLASSHEGFPVAVMEALAVGVPVVATHVGGIPQAVRQGVEGYTVPVGDLDALAGRLSELIEDPERRRAMAQAARRRGEMFDIVEATRALEQVYLSGLTKRLRDRLTCSSSTPARGQFGERDRIRASHPFG